MLLGFLTLYGYFLLFSFVGPPLFTYELVRYRLHLRYQLALAWAFFSIPIVFTILTFLDGAFRFAPAPPKWTSVLPGAILLDGSFVLWLILRLRRPLVIADDDAKT
jgi:hypothetical protein